MVLSMMQEMGEISVAALELLYVVGGNTYKVPLLT